MGYYIEEEVMLQCRKHPSKYRPTGVCPLCLRDRLLRLCPECANVRPCACYPSTSSSSSSSSFSLASSSSDLPASGGGGGVGSIGRVSNLIESEPAFQRSRSAVFPFLRSKISDKDSCSKLPPKTSFWSVFKSHRFKKVEKDDNDDVKMMRSKSVGMVSDSKNVKNDGKMNRRNWFFPSPIKAFRQSKISSSKILHERSPLCRG